MKKHQLLLGVILLCSTVAHAASGPAAAKVTGEVFDLPTGDATEQNATLPPAALPAPAPVIVTATTTTTMPAPAPTTLSSAPPVSARPEGLQRVWESTPVKVKAAPSAVHNVAAPATTMPRLYSRPTPMAPSYLPAPTTTTLPPAPAFVSLAPWYAPNFEGSPAEGWMNSTVGRFLNRSHQNGTEALSLPRRLRVTLALGYQSGQGSLQGLALDPYMRSLVDRVFLDSCELNDRRQNCDFKIVHTTGLETFYTREGVDGLIEEVRVISGAFSEREDMNLGSAAEIQNSRSYQTAQAFAESFADSDLVIYVGRIAPDSGLIFRADGRGSDLTFELGRRDAKTQMLVVVSPDSDAAIVKQVQKSGSRVSVLPVAVRGAASAAAAGLGVVDLFLRQGNLRDLSEFLSQGGL